MKKQNCIIKTIALLLTIVLSLSLFSCGGKKITQEDLDEEAFTAYVGYWDSEMKQSIVKKVDYINLFETRIYYTYPDTKTYVPLEGDADDWEVLEDSYEIADEVYVQNGKLMVKASGTGYIFFKNNATQEIAKLYVNKKVEQEDKYKQTNEKLPYWLYLEKGSYVDFVPGSIALTVYRVDEDGYYTIPYLTICTACGSISTKTPIGIHSLGGGNPGEFSMNGREYWHDWGGGPSSQYAINYYPGVYLHAPTCSSAKESTLWTSSYNQVGTHASGGCLRMQTGSIYWIWTNCPNGTKLEIVDGNPRGTCKELPEPLSDDVIKLYDPTDPYLLTKVHGCDTTFNND